MSRYLALSGKVLDSWAEGPAFGVLEVTDKEAKALAGYVERAKHLAVEIPGFTCFEAYWSVEWCSGVGGGLAAVIGADRVEFLDMIVDGMLTMTPLSKEEYDAVIEHCPSFRTDCDRVQVMANEIIFTCYVKGSDGLSMESIVVPKPVLDRLANGEDAPSIDGRGELLTLEDLAKMMAAGDAEADGDDDADPDRDTKPEADSAEGGSAG